ncbi:hypothetical protein Pla100_33100 [Neorhodopirellula pilleata]|uniref:Uncharacterized protein n=2 Tax=Neorhodopirellula pilleata TaxID=2714738 RepID=A0A5C6A816_9BACT|nr:hypothetical protein Pla100_33100 [Neorhodopirellula pilleata]
MLVVALTGFVAVPRFPSKRGETTERFPCEGCPCGCSSAEYCWDRCCCHSDQEKLQWAHRNAVTPPEFLVQRVAAASDHFASSPIRKSCCGACTASTSTDDSCEDRSACHTAVSDCQAEDARDDQGGKDHSLDDGSKLVLMWKAAECRGLKYFWSMLAATYVSLATDAFVFDSPCSGWVVVFDQHAFSRAMCPDPPVP